MVELKSCGNLVNDSAFSVIDQEVKGDAAPSVVNATIAEISAELEREREKNALLMQRISALEAQLKAQQNQSLFTIAQGSCLNATERRSNKRFKRQNLGSNDNGNKDTNVVNGEKTSQLNQDSQCNPPQDHANVVARHELVNWISMDHETQFLHTDHKLKDEDLVAELDNTDDSDEDYNLVEPSSDGKKTERPTQEPKEAAKLGGIRKLPKMPFCPKEVKRILESEILNSKNAQTHTIRKIIVFASLGIRHGCDDMYGLDFNHFSIQRKGEPYVSANVPGEHVLYENPGVRSKLFFPNHQNPILCPVKVLEEEKSMRPMDPSCPSCFFLCIKYGGSTRNLPQNEYVRQRMGRNKLKSFGPEMCRIAMLVHIRSGSFFFKALGITLLFMAGFPDELVQRETKYRNLDLLQKYYRTDRDAEGEELFHSNPLIRDMQSNQGQQNVTGKPVSTKSKGKRHTKTDHKSTKASVHQTTASTSKSAAQFGQTGYATVHQSLIVTDNSSGSFRYNNQNPYHVFNPQPPNAYVPILYWSPPNPYSYPNFIPLHPQPYYSYPSLVPRMSENVPSGSDSSSSSTQPIAKSPSNN